MGGWIAVVVVVVSLAVYPAVVAVLAKKRDRRWKARIGTAPTMAWHVLVMATATLAFGGLILLVCVGVYTSYVELREERIVIDLEEDGQVAEGTVVDVSWMRPDPPIGPDNNGRLSWYKVSFDDGGRTRTRRLIPGGGTPNYSVGDTVNIRFDPADPTIVSVEGDTNLHSGLRRVVGSTGYLDYLWGWFTIVVIGLFFATGALMDLEPP